MILTKEKSAILGTKNGTGEGRSRAFKSEAKRS